MLKQSLFAVALCSGLLVACQPSGDSPSSDTATSPDANASGSGMLQVAANGEDFVRQGFTSKDDWQISFDHVYAHLSEIKAYQTNPPFDPDTEAPLQSTSEVTLPAETVDLAAGDENAAPVSVSETEAPAGHYNALAWKMTPAENGPAAGQVLMLVGQAIKDGKTVDFTLSFDRELAYTCGEFVGDERKGVVEPGQTANLEATFHFDHIFGNGELQTDDDLNASALGFAPLAALAEEQTLKADWSTLKQKLSPDAFQTLEKALVGLGHVGEGHCRSEVVTS